MTNIAMTAAAPLLDQQLHVLVDADTRAFTLGLAEFGAKVSGRSPKEGEAVRDLLFNLIDAYEADHPKDFATIMKLGRAELRKRADIASVRTKQETPAAG